MYKTPQDWASAWSPYDDETYRLALSYLHPDQTILDIGGGDLRFARMAAQKGCKVIAIEIQPLIALKYGKPPEGVMAIVADARFITFPREIEAAVLLMRHCLDYQLYVEKLRDVGCHTLITNARWGFEPERINLLKGVAFNTHQFGWYACVNCGKVGFLEGSANEIPDEILEAVTEVVTCSQCSIKPEE